MLDRWATTKCMKVDLYFMLQQYFHINTIIQNRHKCITPKCYITFNEQKLFGGHILFKRPPTKRKSGDTLLKIK